MTDLKNKPGHRAAPKDRTRLALRVAGIGIATVCLAAGVAVARGQDAASPDGPGRSGTGAAATNEVVAGTPGDLAVVAPGQVAGQGGSLTGRPTVALRGGHDATLYSPKNGRGVGTSALSILTIPAISVHAPVVRSSLVGADVAIPADVSKVGWFDQSARISDAIGSTVIAGHVSDDSDTPGALYRLDQLKAGDRVRLSWHGAVERFRVTTLRTYSRDRQLPARAFATSGPHRLTLITCTDKVIYPDGHFHYRSNLVVTAVPLSAP